jgi:chaperone modulatory protein CbpM
MDDREFLGRARLEAEALEAWIEAGWLMISRDSERREFTEIDLARAQLIHDLRGDLGVNDEGVGVILDLIDKLHGIRRTLGQLLSAIEAQPSEVRQQLIVSAQQVLLETGVTGSSRGQPRDAHMRAADDADFEP